jgi:hypothetical protein
MPRRCSDSESDPTPGQKFGAFHHVVVSGTACAFHQRIQTFNAGSPASWTCTDDTLRTAGQRSRIVSIT